MNLILVRHAEAVDKGTNGVERDFDRHLTENGIEQARKLAEALVGQGVSLDVVVSSPLVRAVQTAGPLLSLVPHGVDQPTICEYLAQGEYRPKKISRFAEELGKETIALVGHNPDLSTYASWLLDGEDTSVELEKAAAAWITIEKDVERGAGVLRWLITPKWFMGTKETAVAAGGHANNGNGEK